MSKKSSQEERPWPSTQQMLLDHLRRIVEGVAEGDGIWYFGFGEDCLISMDPTLQQPNEGDFVRKAKIQMFLTALAVEARDRPSGSPTFKDYQAAIKALAECFDDRPDPHELFRKVLPESADPETLQRAYAFEMLSKLDRVADRSKQEAVREILLLENLPQEVDDYMAEAAVCFRYGFDKACLAVCRAVLEESLKCRSGRRQSRKKTLYDLIDEAKTQGYLNDTLAKVAHQIRCWGRDAVHGPKKGTVSKAELECRAHGALLYSKQILRHLWSSNS